MSDETTADDRGRRRHDPVLLQEVLECFEEVDAPEPLVDATVGAAGHSEALLEQKSGRRLIGIDRDPSALAIAKGALERFGDRVRLVHGRHEELFDILSELGVDRISGLLADLGVSSMQFDEAERGFSFRHDAPLDMRMSGEGETAADLVNSLDEEELIRIFRAYGEEPMARPIARAIIEDRATQPFTTTRQLADLLRSVKRRSREKIDPATLVFQALRIAVNRELVGLEEFIRAAVDRTVEGGRVAIISFHSLEDRIVKQTFRSLEGRCVCPPRMPVCRCGAKAIVRVLTKRPLEATEEEIRSNPRSRSAKLRVAEKLASQE
jgi:16S rRNA (cytosine1402-N4)-methyltransferase